jgi:prolyl-tRNA synthetase
MAEKGKIKTAITPTRSEDYPEWYQQVIKAADLAENSPVRGCMVIKPWGYSLWENIQKVLDKKFKQTGHKNAYFPLFIPKSFLEKEAEHVEGFAKECAVVTHHRLEAGPEGKLIPAGELEEPLIVRPTSETIIGAMFSKWTQSYRDLPLLINQWANVVRWEMRTRLFLRTAEFLWQEGHTAHATIEEAKIETMKMLDIYADFAENYMAMPVIKGEKTDSERFPGAVSTYCIEAMMQDRKALQAGTSHFLGQNFSKASDIRFLDSNGKEEYAWTTSWGVSTRLIGGMIMTHGDDDGLIVPPRLAPAHIVILPIIHDDSSAATVMEYCEKLSAELNDLKYNDTEVVAELDKKEGRGGDKVWSWIKKGVPVYLEIGPRDVAADSVFVGRRDKSRKERYSQKRAEFLASVPSLLDDIQNNLLQRAKAFRDSNIKKIDSKDEFYSFFTPANKEKPEIHGGFALCHWNGSAEVERKVKEDLNVTIRCIPLEGAEEHGKCIITGEPSAKRVLFAKAY